MKFSVKTGCTDNVHHAQITSHVCQSKHNQLLINKLEWFLACWFSSFSINFAMDFHSDLFSNGSVFHSRHAPMYIQSTKPLKRQLNPHLHWRLLSHCLGEYYIMFWKCCGKWVPNLCITCVDTSHDQKSSNLILWPSQPFTLFSQMKQRSLWANWP